MRYGGGGWPFMSGEVWPTWGNTLKSILGYVKEGEEKVPVAPTS